MIAAKVNNAVGKLDANGDGTEGDNFLLDGTKSNDLFRLFGDADGNGRVDGIDFGLFRAAFGTKAGDPGYNIAFDWDNNGYIDGAIDYFHFRAAFGTGLPLLP